MGVVETAAAACLVFFSAALPDNRTLLYRTDGTPGGTFSVSQSSGIAAADPWFRSFTPLRGRLLFSAMSERDGRELWVSDGTVRGTKQIGDLEPGKKSSSPLGSIADGRFAILDDKALLTTDTYRGGTSLWVTDGSSNGTRRLKKFDRDAYGQAAEVVIASDRFAIVQGSIGGSKFLWSVDSETLELQRLMKLPDDGNDFFDRTSYTAVPLGRNKVVIGLGHPWISSVDRIVISDGTPKGTVMHYPSFEVPAMFGSRDLDYAVFYGEEWDRNEDVLWKSDGKTLYTEILLRGFVNRDLTDEAIVSFAQAGDDVFALVNGRGTKDGLWRLNGKAKGTTRVEAIKDMQDSHAMLSARADSLLLALSRYKKKGSKTSYFDTINVTSGKPGNFDLLYRGSVQLEAGLAQIGKTVLFTEEVDGAGRLVAMSPSGRKKPLQSQSRSGGRDATSLTAVPSGKASDCFGG